MRFSRKTGMRPSSSVVRLARIRERNLLAPELCTICDEVNRGRNHFLHWKPGRFSVPTYCEVDITTSEGNRKVLQDISAVIEAIIGTR